MALEAVATAYLIQVPDDLWMGVYGLTCVGGLIGSIAGFWLTKPLRRPAYFFWASLLVMAISGSQYWLASGPAAIVAGAAWPLMIKLMLGPVVGGFLIGLLSAARSLDAFGHPKAAPLAFVPLVNLWLVLAPSRIPKERQEDVGPVSGAGVASAFAGLLLLTGANIFGSLLVNDVARAFGDAEGVPLDVSVQYLVNVRGVNGGAVFIADLATPPYQLSDTLTLSDMEASGSELTTTYTYTGNAPLTEAFWSEVRHDACSAALKAPLVKAGATMREIYVDGGGRQLGDMAVTRQDCHLKPEVGAWSRLAGLIGGWPQMMTLEYRAVGFSLDADWRIQTAGLCLLAIGGLFAALFQPRGGTARLGRGLYFLGNCALILAAAVSLALLIPTREAVFGGYVGWKVVLWALVQAACGFGLWHLAVLRSRSAYGHGKAAVLAFVPIANVLLLIAPERETADGRGAAEVVVRSRRTAMPIAAGLAGLALLGLAYVAAEEIDARTIVSLVVNEDFPPEMRVEHMLGRIGLEKTLEAATEAPPEPDGDKLVPQLAHSAQGKELLRTFLITPRVLAEMERGNPIFATFFTVMARNEVCDGRTFIPLLQAGATVINSYGDGARERARITLTAADCGL